LTCNRTFKLTEQVCLQCASVALQAAGWKEWFCNPTAGPWKRIKINGVPDSQLTRFGKKENRPDLIAYNKTHSLVLVIEAKDVLRKLVAPEQFSKTQGVFTSVRRRIRQLIRQYEVLQLPSARELKILCGYLFPLQEDSRFSTTLNGLRRMHQRSGSAAEHVLFVVQRKGNDLYVLFDSTGCSRTTGATLAKALGGLGKYDTR